MRVVLASASPRRKELLTQIGIRFDIVVSAVEEVITKTLPYEVVCELSEQKARAVLETIPAEEDILVIGADTVVAAENEILGKPGTKERAAEMLRSLSGRSHTVYTGVTALYRKAGEQQIQSKIFYEATGVTFYEMSEAEIAEYAASGDSLDKAGAYGIQGFCARYISGIEGDYNNVVGLPIGRLYQEIKEWLF